MGEFNYEEEFHNWKWNIPRNYNIGYDCVDKHTITNKKNKIALYWENADGESDKLTFYDISRLTNKFGNILKNLGVKKGDRYLILLPNIPEFQISFLGGVKIGAISIPLSIMSKAHEIEYIINDSNLKAVITTSKFNKEIKEIKGKCSTLEFIVCIDETYDDFLSYNELMKDSSSDLEIENTSKDDIAFLYYTSSSKENPKGVVHLQQWVPANDPNVLFWQQAKENDLVAHTGDLNWIYPLGNGFLYPWRWGISTFVYHGRFIPERWLGLIEKYRITNLASVPNAYSMLLDIKVANKKYDLSSLRHCISAGKLLKPEFLNNWKKSFDLDIYDGIGMAEINVYLSNYKGMKVKPGSYGKPQPGKICKIVDHNGNTVPPGKPGILAIKQTDPGLFKEYWNKPDKTNESFKNGWFLTDNILYQDKDGYFWFNEKFTNEFPNK
jgi:acetyl-CoA synthetase